MALGIVVIPILTGKLGKDLFGVVILAESVIVFFQLFIYNIRTALARFATISLSKGNHDELVGYLSTGKCILYVCMLPCLFLGSILSFYFPVLLHVPDGFQQDSQLLFLLITLAFTLSIPNALCWAILYAQQRLDLINIAISFSLIIRAALILVFFQFFPDQYANLVTYGIIFGAITLTENGLIYVWSRDAIPNLKITFGNYQKKMVREIISFGGYMSLSGLSVVLYESVINIIINLLWGPAINAIYAISVKFPNLMQRIFTQSTWALTPTFTDLIARNDKRRVEILFFSYSKFLFCAILPIGFTLVLFSRDLIFFWVGEEFLLSAQLMPIFLIGTLIATPFSICGCITTAYGKVQVPALVNLGVASCSLILGVFLGYILDLRLLGIASSTFLMLILGSAVFLPYYACKISGFSFKTLIWESLLKPLLLAGCIVVGGICVLYWSWNAQSLFVKLLAIPILSACFYLCGYFLLLHYSERALLLNLMKPFLKFGKLILSTSTVLIQRYVRY